MSEEWVDVNEDLPQLDTHYNNLSKDVIVITDKYTEFKAFYNYETDIWHYANNSKPIKNYNIVAWKG